MHSAYKNNFTETRGTIMLFGRRKPGYTTTVDAASDPEQVILDLQKAEMAAKRSRRPRF